MQKEKSWRSVVNNKEVSASLAGKIRLAGNCLCIDSVLGRCASPEKASGARQKTGRRRWQFFAAPWSLMSNSSTLPIPNGPYTSEELIAEALSPYQAGLVIATKGGWNRPGPNQWTHNATPAHLRDAVEGSLKRLRLERIDVYQLHIPDPVVSFEASVETLAQLRSEGKIRLVALSNVTQEHIERARRIVPIVSVQNRYSFADREWDYVANYCEHNRIAFIPWFPLGAGRVAGEVLNRIAQTHGASPTQIALAWLLRRSPIMLPIPGTSSVEHLEQNVAAASLHLTEEEYEQLSRVPELVGSR
jgi:pyridoxine 4-dehydrogenase